jgi:DNA topoisomerase-3
MYYTERIDACQCVLVKSLPNHKISIKESEENMMGSNNEQNPKTASVDTIVTERRGLGTPATRAATIEKLIKSGYVIRKGRQLLPTDKGVALIAVLPGALTSPRLTAQWEDQLQLVEKGELSADSFMDGITAFVKAIVAENSVPIPEFVRLFNASKTASDQLGICPRCGSAVREGTRGFFCDAHSCGFKMWKESKFWTAKKQTLTAAIVTVLLKDGRVALKGLHSEKTGKKYDATIILDDTGGHVNYRMEFDKS